MVALQSKSHIYGRPSIKMTHLWSPMQMYTAHADVHDPCRRTQPMQTYTTHAGVYNPCRCTQPMQTYTTHADVHNPCRHAHATLCNPCGVDGGIRTAGRVPDAAGQRETTKGRMPWAGEGISEDVPGPEMRAGYHAPRPGRAKGGLASAKIFPSKVWPRWSRRLSFQGARRPTRPIWPSTVIIITAADSH